MLFQVKRCVYVRNSVEFTVWSLADVLSACSLQHLVSASSGSNDGKLVVTRAVQSLFDSLIRLALLRKRNGKTNASDLRARSLVRRHYVCSSYLVDPASSHMLVSKIKPCMCKYKH